MSESTMKLSKELKSIAKNLDSEIEKAAGESIAFTLIVYTEGRASYISSCERSDSIREMKRLIELWESGMSDVPAHEVS